MVVGNQMYQLHYYHHHCDCGFAVVGSHGIDYYVVLKLGSDSVISEFEFLQLILIGVNGGST